MSSKNKKKSGKGFAIVIGIIWGLILVNLFAFAIFSKRVDVYYHDPQYMADSLMSRQYADLYTSYSNLIYYDVDVNKYTEYIEMEAVYDYLQAAGQYKVYADNGFEEQAQRYKSKMDDAALRMGGLTYVPAEINEMLGIR